MSIVRPAALRELRSAVLKPAVLGVTAWKSERQMRFPSGYAVYSPKNRNSAGITINSAVALKITLLCIR